MLGVFLLLAFTRLGHKCQNLLSLCNGMHVCTDLGLYSHPKEFWGNAIVVSLFYVYAKRTSWKILGECYCGVLILCAC